MHYLHVAVQNAYEFLSCEGLYSLPFVVLPVSLNLACCHLLYSQGKEENPISTWTELGDPCLDLVDLGEAERLYFDKQPTQFLKLCVVFFFFSTCFACDFLHREPMHHQFNLG